MLLLLAMLALSACGGSSTSASSSPSAEPSPVAASPRPPPPSATPLPTPTVAGTIAFTKVSPTESDAADICVIRTDGTGLKQLTDDPGWEEHPSWSPDGKRVVYDAGSSEPFDNSIWVMSADGSGKTKLTYGYHPHWSPDGKQIVFVRYMGGSRGEDVFVVNVDGSGVRRVIDLTPDDTDPSWAPDGRIVSTLGHDVFSMNLDGGGRVRLTKGKNVMDSAVSPDGKRLAYHDLDADLVEVAPLSNADTPVSLLDPVSDYITGDIEAAPAWAPDGEAIAVAANGSIGSPLYIVMADGTGLSAIPGVENAMDPAWRPGPKGPANLADLAPWTTDVGWGAYSVGRYGFTSPDKNDKIEKGDRIVAHGKWYRHGLFAHAPSELTFELGGAFATFSTTIVMVETISGPDVDGAIFVVELDGAEIYRSKPMFPSSQPRHLKLRVAGGQLLTLITAPRGGNDSDWTIWGDPSLR